jgi:hypothetical protein
MTGLVAKAILFGIAAWGFLAPAQALTVSNGSYYEETVSAACPSSTTCRLDFTRIGSKAIMLRHLLCRVTGNMPIRFGTIGVATSAGGTPARVTPIEPRFFYGSNATQIYTVAMDTHYLLSGGSFPQVQFTGDVTIPEVVCTIVGTTFDSKASF